MTQEERIAQDTATYQKIASRSTESCAERRKNAGEGISHLTIITTVLTHAAIYKLDLNREVDIPFYEGDEESRMSVSAALSLLTSDLIDRFGE